MKAMFYWVWDLNMIPAHVPWETISVDMATGNTNVQEEGEICFVGIKNFLYFFFFFLVILFSLFLIRHCFLPCYFGCMQVSHPLVFSFYGHPVFFFSLFFNLCFIHTPELKWRVGYWIQFYFFFVHIYS